MSKRHDWIYTTWFDVTRPEKSVATSNTTNLSAAGTVPCVAV